MADLKLTGLTALAAASQATGDLMEVVDVSDTTMAATGTNKSMTLSALGLFGTSGSIPFYASGGNVSQDNTNLFWNTTTKDLKISSIYYNAALNSRETVGAQRFTGTANQRISHSFAQTVNVSNAADNGSGLIRITTSAVHSLSTGAQVIIGSVGGTTEANSSWTVTVIDTTNIDLQGSTFTNAYTSGGTVNPIVGTATVTLTGRIMVPSSNPSTQGGILGISTSATAQSTSSLWFSILTTGVLRLAISDSSSSSNRRIYSVDNNLVTNWGGQPVHIAATRSGTTVLIYINGVLQAATEGTAGTPPADWSGSLTGTNFVIGIDNSSTLTYNQRIYNARFYAGVALSASEINDEMAYGVANGYRWGSLQSATAGCVLDSDLENADTATSTTIRDISSNAFSGTSNASPVQLEPVPQLNTSFIRMGNGVTRKGASGTSSGFFVANTGTYTDNATAASGTASSFAFYSILTPTLAASSTSVVTTDVATWYIAAAPTAGTNMTLTNAYALWVDAGTSRFDGTVIVGSGEGGSPGNGIVRNANAAGTNINGTQLVLTAGLGTGTGSNGVISFSAPLAKAASGTTPHTLSTTLFQIGASQSSHPAASGFAARFGSQTLNDENTAGSGTAATATGISIGTYTLAATNTSVTTTNAAAFYIANSVQAGTNMTLTNSWSIWVDAGNCRFDGNLDFSTADATNLVLGSSTGTKIGTATTQKLGFWNATPVVQLGAYTITNDVTDRSYDANATTIDELADVVATLYRDLKTIGLFA